MIRTKLKSSVPEFYFDEIGERVARRIKSTLREFGVEMKRGSEPVFVSDELFAAIVTEEARAAFTGSDTEEAEVITDDINPA